MGNTIFPKALERAAKAFADRPKMLGEILVTLFLAGAVAFCWLCCAASGYSWN